MGRDIYLVLSREEVSGTSGIHLGDKRTGYLLHAAEKGNIPGFGLWPALEVVVYLRKGGQVYPPLQVEHSPAGRVQEVGEL